MARCGFCTRSFDVRHLHEETGLCELCSQIPNIGQHRDVLECESAYPPNDVTIALNAILQKLNKKHVSLWDDPKERLLEYLRSRVDYYRSLQIPFDHIPLGMDVGSARGAKDALKDVIRFIEEEDNDPT